MPPAFTAEYSTNLGLADSKAFGDALLRPSILAEIKDVVNISFSELVLCIALAIEVAVFCSHIAEIVGAGAKKQMFGINASWVIAAMTDKHPIRDLAFMHLIRETMCV